MKENRLILFSTVQLFFKVPEKDTFWQIGEKYNVGFVTEMGIKYCTCLSKNNGSGTLKMSLISSLKILRNACHRC